MFRAGSALLLLGLLCACARSGREDSAVTEPPPETRAGPQPVAVLRAGEYPLWFQLTERGPALIDSIEDARFSAAFIPWPLALHIRAMLARGDELVMAVNRDGFYRLAPADARSLPAVEGGLALYYMPGGEFWRQYTVGSFVWAEGKPAALLYRDERFLDSDAELPRPRMWTIAAESAGPEGLAVPALDEFPPEEGWDADTLRYGADGFWYFRVINKNKEQADIRMFRAAELGQAGEAVSIAAFQNSAMPEPLSAAPSPLRALLNAAFAGTGGASALVLSPDFPQPRVFAGTGQGGPGLAAYYREKPEAPVAVAILPGGKGLYSGGTEASSPSSFEPFSLPPLPEGFVYTGIGLAGGVLCAAWEEQEEFSVGAAGFMVIQINGLM